MKKVIFISSSGGHLSELMQLKELFEDYDYHIVTEKTESTEKLKEKYDKKIDYLLFGARNYIFVYFFKFIYNIIKSLIIYLKIWNHPTNRPFNFEIWVGSLKAVDTSGSPLQYLL